MIDPRMNTNAAMSCTVPDQETQPPQTNLVLCNFCDQSKAILHCRADAASLCLACDRQVHSTNPLFTKHHRSLLCNSCNSSPASIFCSTESSVLCQNCDWEAHDRGLSRNVHERRPLEGFCGVPCVGEFLGFLGLDDDFVKNGDDYHDDDEGFCEMFAWETTPLVLSMDDLIVNGNGVGIKAMGLPPLPKNRNAMCGKDRDEILRQLRELGKIEPNFNGSLKDFEPLVVEVQQQQVHGNNTNPGLENIASMPSYETNELKWYDFNEEIGFPSSYLDSFVEANNIPPNNDTDTKDCTVISDSTNVHSHDVPEDSENFQAPPKPIARELSREERGSALSRYKAKKKTRRYDKHIRYESRKVRAETRTRVKGRFAKMDC